MAEGRAQPVPGDMSGAERPAGLILRDASSAFAVATYLNDCTGPNAGFRGFGKLIRRRFDAAGWSH